MFWLGDNKLKQKFDLKESTILGLDIGIASCGWALIDTKDKIIVGAGVWGFEVPEVPKTRASKAAERRTFRGQRRRLRRRRQRMTDIRQLLHEHGLLASPHPPKDEKGNPKPNLDPWRTRAEGLDRKLTGEEFAAALIHIAKHRGYRSNSKSEKAANAPAEDKKVLSGIAEIEERSARYRTVGQMFATDPKFAEKKRNRDGDYSHTVLRALHEHEVQELFKAQRQFGSTCAREGLEERFAELAFFQRPLQDSEKLLGKCPFEPVEYRASSLSPSFEKFRYLQKLVNTKINDGSRTGRRLTPAELSAAANGFGRSAKSISWRGLKKLIGADADTRFVGVGEKDEGKDVARDSTGCAFGTKTVFDVLGEEGWTSLDDKTRDAIVHVLTFREDIARIRSGLIELGLAPVILEPIMTAASDGKFARFNRAGHISTKAARNIIPGLLQGKVYSEACELAGYDHAAERPLNLDSITSPVAKRAIRESLKQVNAIVRYYGFRPGAIHVELGRDVGKGPDERGRIEAGIKRRTNEKDAAYNDLCDLLGKSDCSAMELQRYELWQEQMHNCMFCYPENKIHCQDLRDNSQMVEIEHILPRSRSHDNSWNNKVLVCTKCNRDKGNRTPFEWFGDDGNRWLEFELRARALKAEGRIKGFKIRNLLLKNFAEVQESFLGRNLNDMRYASKVVAEEMRKLYIDQDKPGRRVYARPGAITAALRHTWGVNGFKYLEREDGKKDRLEDGRHHAVDAIVLAACSEAALQRLTKAIQKERETGSPVTNVSSKIFRPPWPSFSDDLKAAHAKTIVARGENRRARGAGHLATIRQVREENGLRIAYERVAVGELTDAALDRIKDPDRNTDTVRALREWIAAGKPADALPRRANGHLIKKIRLRSEKKATTERTGFKAHGGLVDNADMVRVDVFEKENKFYLVPIYAHQVADKEQWPEPPDRAISANTPEDQWEVIDQSFSFHFSLYPYSLVEVVTRQGEVIRGYYRGTDRSTGAVTLSDCLSKQRLIRGIGARTLRQFQKFQMDRTGDAHEIGREVRTWHGKACT